LPVYSTLVMLICALFVLLTTVRVSIFYFYV
jgi:hypothetical protein